MTSFHIFIGLNQASFLNQFLDTSVMDCSAFVNQTVIMFKGFIPADFSINNFTTFLAEQHESLSFLAIEKDTQSSIIAIGYLKFANIELSAMLTLEYLILNNTNVKLHKSIADSVSLLSFLKELKDPEDKILIDYEIRIPNNVETISIDFEKRNFTDLSQCYYDDTSTADSTPSVTRPTSSYDFINEYEDNGQSCWSTPENDGWAVDINEYKIQPNEIEATLGLFTHSLQIPEESPFRTLAMHEDNDLYQIPEISQETLSKISSNLISFIDD